MTEQSAAASAVEKSLGRVRICVLVGIAICAAVILSRDAAEEEPPVEPVVTVVALLLATGSIALRRLAAVATTAPRSAVSFALSGMLLALGLGGLGVAVSLGQAARETGLLLALGGFILALPRPHVPSLANSSRR